MTEATWFTGITDAQPNRVLLRGYPVQELMGRVSFTDAIYLVLMGELPTVRQRTLVDAVLVCAVDHSITPPTARTARTVATARPPLVSSLAAGILSVSDLHGGAIEGAMRMMLGVEKAWAAGADLNEAAAAKVEVYRDRGARVPGFGHRMHTDDPRAIRLLALLQESSTESRFAQVALVLERAVEAALGLRLAFNVDGAIAAVLCELGMPPALANGFFALSRIPGLMAHVYEEWTRERPMRTPDFGAAGYDGPAERHLSEE
jgi:citrate synthase